MSGQAQEGVPNHIVSRPPRSKSSQHSAEKARPQQQNVSEKENVAPLSVRRSARLQRRQKEAQLVLLPFDFACFRCLPTALILASLTC